MGLIFWWMLLVWIVALAGYGLVRYILFRRRKAKPSKTIPIAHSERLTDLPEYKTAMHKYQILIRLSAASLSIALLGTVILSARPASISLITPANKSRDIMLCLDVSGSLLRTDTKIVNRFTTFINNFDGQRIGLTLFNSSSIVIMPLNDDYQLITSQLTKVGTALQKQKGTDFTNYTSGTLADFDKGTSLMSDGLVSCINGLGQNPQQRSQSVILATDNEVNGTPIITAAQAKALAQKRNVHIYAIDPGQSDESRKEQHTELKSIAEQTGGGYYPLSNDGLVESIIAAISKQESKYAAGVQVVATVDAPSPILTVVILMTLISLALVWRLRI